MTNLSFRDLRELSRGLHLQQKDEDKNIWPSVAVARCVTRRAIGTVLLSKFELQILNR